MGFTWRGLPENIAKCGVCVITIPPSMFRGLDICLIDGSESFDDSASLSYYLSVC